MRRLIVAILFAAACSGGSSGSGNGGPPSPTADAGPVVGPGDAGPVVGPSDAGLQGPGSPAPDGGVPVPDAGPAPSDGGSASNPADAGSGLACGATPACDASEPSSLQAATCAAPPVPQEPVQFAFDGGIPGPCTEDDFDNAGDLIQHMTATYDDHRRELARTVSDGAGRQVFTVKSEYDSCGNLVWQHSAATGDQKIRNYYGADGLLTRTDTDQDGTCRSAPRAYHRNASNLIDFIYDPAACVVTDDLSYGADGRVSKDVQAPGVSGSEHSFSFGFFPDGALQEEDFSGTFGTAFRNRTFDEAGRLVEQKSNIGASTANTIDVTTHYRPDGQVQEIDTLRTGIGCGDGSTKSVNTFVGSTLTRTDITTTSGCQVTVTTASIDYTYAGNVRTAVHRDGNGNVTSTDRSTLDSRGNELSKETAPPGGTFVKVFSRSFDGCGLPPAP